MHTDRTRTVGGVICVDMCSSVVKNAFAAVARAVDESYEIKIK